MSEFLLELYSEEIPPQLQINARSQLKQFIEKSLKKEGIDYKACLEYSSPTRLSICIKGLPDNIKIKPNEIRGPKVGIENNVLEFLYQLIELIKERVKYTPRHLGPAWPSGRTLSERVGSCRDLAMLMVECCRSVGIPSRFISGYHFEEVPSNEYDLHAWAELYIPGAGWRGFDPSGKGLIDERYLTLVSSSKSNLTAVITGNFIGKTNLENSLSWEIKPIIMK